MGPWVLEVTHTPPQCTSFSCSSKGRGLPLSRFCPRPVPPLRSPAISCSCKASPNPWFLCLRLNTNQTDKSLLASASRLPPRVLSAAAQSVFAAPAASRLARPPTHSARLLPTLLPAPLIRHHFPQVSIWAAPRPPAGLCVLDLSAHSAQNSLPAPGPRPLLLPFLPVESPASSPTFSSCLPMLFSWGYAPRPGVWLQPRPPSGPYNLPVPSSASFLVLLR